MNSDDDLQRSFDAAGSRVNLGSGSLEGVKRRAAQRTRNARLVAGAAGVVVVFGAARLLSFPQPSAMEVAAGGSPDTTIEAEVTDTTIEAEPTDTGTDAEPSDSTEEPEPEIGDTSGLTEDDFSYLGAFMAPAGQFGDSTFAYGGEAAAFNPAGDPDNQDNFAGSLFMTGHPRENLGIAEMAIPEPASHSGTSTGLPVAEVLQDFGDITAGRGAELVGSEAVGGSGEYRYGGLEVVEDQGGARLHWSIWQYGNVSENVVPGHGHSSLDVSNPDPQGPWFLGDRPNLQTAGYLTTIPEDFAERHLGGYRMLVGYKEADTGGTGSWGPPFFAYQPPATDEPNATLDVSQLAFYDQDHPLIEYGQADVSPGAAWITTSEGTEAIVTVGRRGLGEVRQGIPQEGDCSEYAGVHADPYEPQILFYNPADLAAVAAGSLRPDQVEPYRRWNPAEHLITNCAWFLSSISFDAESDRVYIVQVESDLSQEQFSPVPVIHVFQL